MTTFSSCRTIMILLVGFTFLLPTHAFKKTTQPLLVRRAPDIDYSNTELFLQKVTSNPPTTALKDDFTASSGQANSITVRRKGGLLGAKHNCPFDGCLTGHDMSQADAHRLSRRDAQTTPTPTTQRSPRPRPTPRPEGRPSTNRGNPSDREGGGPVCRPRHLYNVSGSAEGRIQWRDPRFSCTTTYEWLITVPAGNGVTFTFTSIDMLSRDLFQIHEFSGESRTPVWTSLNGTFMAPLLVRSNRVMLVVRKPPCVPPDRPAQASVSSQPSSFNLNYTAHPERFMPQEVQADEGGGFRTSSVMYNCSMHPKIIPRALRCDMVQQCVHGEDEEDCTYKSAGCGDWVPYRDRCLKAFFKPVTYLSRGRSHVTMPIPALEACKTHFQATLVRLPENLGIQIAAEIVRNSGYHSAAVGLRKMRPRSPKIKQLYKYVWQWGARGSVAYDQVEIQRNNPVTDCAAFDLTVDSYIRPMHCTTATSKQSVPSGIICMKQNPLRKRGTELRLKALHLQPAARRVTVFPTKTCPDGSLVQTFHPCEWPGVRVNRPRESPVFPGFQCQLGHSIHYSFVCDAIDDCPDGSDEVNCMEPMLEPLKKIIFTCTSLQTIPRSKRCNGINDCFDNSDEEDCIICRNDTDICPSLGCIPMSYKRNFDSCEVPNRSELRKPPRMFSLAAVQLDGFGMSSLKNAGVKCSEGYFQCDKHLCIPTFMLNNGEMDCPSGVDEGIPMENVTCPGYYRCHLSGNCIHGHHLCDGIPHCPNKDDERYCDLNCPTNCTCEGYAYKCQSMFNPLEHLNTRYLDISGVIQPLLNNIESMEYLIFLNLSHCELTYVNLTSMPRLQKLDLSHNLLEELSAINFSELDGLRYLSLSNNPLVRSIDATFAQFVKVSGMIHLSDLSLVNTGLCAIEGGAIASLPELTDLDLRGNDVKYFDKNVFTGLSHLNKLRADNYKLCCPYFQDVAIPQCHAPVDELSSCDDLLNNLFFQMSVWILAAFNIPANIAVLAYRVWEVKKKSSKTYTILVGNLCLSDLLMGIYLVFIGSADVHYRDVWVSEGAEWTGSQLCKVAGILAFLSSQVSAFVICLITLERLLVICFPLRNQLHMTRRSSSLACALAWLLGLLLATVPVMTDWELYGQNGFCLPLPITRTQFPGQQYMFAVFIYVNFVLFIIIGIGQLCIYLAIRRVRMSSSVSKLQDMTIARRLMLIIVTDFLCWFPIGLMGVLSSLGTPIPGQVNVWTALFILPFNSALNPHLYTLNSLLDKHRERRMNQRIQKTIGKIHVEIHKWPVDKVERLLKTCLQTRVIQNKKVLQWMKLKSNPEETEELELEMAREYDSRSDAELTTKSTNCL